MICADVRFMPAHPHMLLITMLHILFIMFTEGPLQFLPGVSVGSSLIIYSDMRAMLKVSYFLTLSSWSGKIFYNFPEKTICLYSL